jgi:hypothetical protein
MDLRSPPLAFAYLPGADPALSVAALIPLALRPVRVGLPLPFWQLFSAALVQLRGGACATFRPRKVGAAARKPEEACDFQGLIEPAGAEPGGKGAVELLEIDISPSGMLFNAGSGLNLILQGTDIQKCSTTRHCVCGRHDSMHHDDDVTRTGGAVDSCLRGPGVPVHRGGCRLGGHARATPCCSPGRAQRGLG